MEMPNYKVIKTIVKRELLHYFSTPIAYIFSIMTLSLLGVFTFYIGHFYDRDQADLEVFFFFHPWVYLLLIPSITMRLWAEERKSGTIELLLTLPVSPWSWVLGKFLAAWIFVAITMSLSSTMWITVNYLGEPDNLRILLSYFGSLLLAGSFLSVGCILSVISRNQIVSFISTVGVLLILMLIGLPDTWKFLSGGTDNFLPTWAIEMILSIGAIPHFDNFIKGILVLSDVVYFVSLIAFSLLANIILLDMKKGE